VRVSVNMMHLHSRVGIWYSNMHIEGISFTNLEMTLRIDLKACLVICGILVSTHSYHFRKSQCTS